MILVSPFRFLVRYSTGRPRSAAQSIAAFPPRFSCSPRLQADGPKHRCLKSGNCEYGSPIAEPRVSFWSGYHPPLTVTLPLASNSRVAIHTKPRETMKLFNPLKIREIELKNR